MNKVKSLVLILILFFSGYSSAVFADDLQVQVVKSSDWDTGFCAKVSVFNPNSESEEWNIAFDAGGLITGLWSAKYTQDKTTLETTVSGRNWNKIVNANAEVKFSYCAKKIKTAPVAPQAGDLTVTQTSTSDWNQGFCKKVNVKNNTSHDIDWEVTFPVDGTIKNLWSANYQQNAQTLEVTAFGRNGNNVIKADAEMNFSYCAKKIITTSSSEKAALNADKAALTFASIKQDNATKNTIKTALLLPSSGAEGSTITWQSSHSAISIDGQVTRPAIGESNQKVHLTATLNNGTLSKNKKFTLKVIALEAETTTTETETETETTTSETETETETETTTSETETETETETTTSETETETETETTACTTTVNAGESIQAAINSASNNDTICVKSGSYTEAIMIEDVENLTIQGEGLPTISKNLVIRANAGGTTIKGFKFDLYGMCNEVAITLRTGTHNVTLQDNEFYNAHLGGIDVEATTGGVHIPNENLIIKNNYFERIPTAISIVGKNHLVENNRVFRSTQTVPHPTLGQCAFVRNLDADGIKFYGQDHVIKNNRFEKFSFYSNLDTLYDPATADPLLKDSHTDCFQTSSMSWFSNDNSYRNNRTNNIHIQGNFCQSYSVKNLRNGDSAGIMFLEDAEDIYFYNNFTDSSSIGSKGTVKNIHIYNNTMTMNSRLWRDMVYTGAGSYSQDSEAAALIAMQTDFPTTIHIHNNIFYDSHHMPVLVYGADWSNSDQANVSNNIAFWRDDLDNSGNGAWTSNNGLTSTWKYFDNCSSTPDSNGNRCIDPQFTDINQHDFSLKTNSPAIDAANVVQSSPETDYFGNKRPSGAANDIGAYEVQP